MMMRMRVMSLCALMIVSINISIRGANAITNNISSRDVSDKSNHILNVDRSDYLSWILKSVCQDTITGQVLSNDPYYGCPSGSIMRKYKAGDPITYNNYEQMGYQVSDSFEILDANGEKLILHNFDYFPFNEFNQHSGSDGYDIYHVSSDTVSYSNTKDGGGYGSTFFGDKCSFGNGWALFPTKDFLSGGQGYWPISGIYWEQDGQAHPGSCPSGYSRNTLTLWELSSAYAFSGVNGNPSKSMDTLVSYHGFETDDGSTPTPSFLKQGHLEVFYFTMEYGIARWEVWAPTAQLDIRKAQRNATHFDAIAHSGRITIPIAGLAAMSECSGDSQVQFKNTAFTIIACHDWTNVKPLSSPIVPIWPVVNANLLQHHHFDSGLVDGSKGFGQWHRFGTNPYSNQQTNWSIRTSTGSSDANNGRGTKYLAVNCAAIDSRGCGPSGTQAVYQDISPTSVVPGATYMIGANIRTEGGPGSLSLVLQLIDNAGAVLFQDLITSTISSDNGDGRGSEGQSVYLSSKFVSKIVSLPQVDGTMLHSMRFLVVINDPVTFDVVDSFVNRYA